MLVQWNENYWLNINSSVALYFRATRRVRDIVLYWKIYKGLLS